MRGLSRRSALLILLALSCPHAPALAQARPPGLSWIEAGGFSQHVSNDFGDWKGVYGRAVLVSSRNAWYLDAKAQEAFRDKGVYGSLANVHTFSSRFYTLLGVGGGTGDFVLPDLRLDASLNFKVGRSRALIVSAGGTFVDAKLGYRDKALFGSLTWYAGGTFLAEAGVRGTWSNPGSVGSARGFGSLSLGRTGGNLLALRGSAGTEGYQLTGLPTTLRKFRSQEAGLSWRHWFSRGFGSVLGGEWYHNPFYTRAGAMAGLFRAW